MYRGLSLVESQVASAATPVFRLLVPSLPVEARELYCLWGNGSRTDLQGVSVENSAVCVHSQRGTFANVRCLV
jgi:hypothetical protein